MADIYVEISVILKLDEKLNIWVKNGTDEYELNVDTKGWKRNQSLPLESDFNYEVNRISNFYPTFP